MIVPYNGKQLSGTDGVVNYDLRLVLICLGTCVAGVALGYWMSLLEKKYKE
jgi:hypothetical protein